jgi:SAM-dependent methyltransferase
MPGDYATNDNSGIYYSGKYWNDYPECLSIINRRLFNEDIDWKAYLIKNDYKNLGKALILNCGNGWVERELIDSGIINSAVGVEYSEELVSECEKEKEGRNLEYVCHDMNTVSFPTAHFDVVINFAAGHHIRFLERVWMNITKWLKPNGFFIQNDYIGPQRNQYSIKQWEAMKRMNKRLPVQYRKELNYPDVIQMMRDDPTEAINSGKILPTTYALFDVITHTKSGGVVAYELLTHNDKLFNASAEQRKTIVDEIMREDEAYLDKTGDSFFHFLICKNSKEVTDEVQNSLIEEMNDREDLADQTYGQYSYNELSIDTVVKCNDNTHWGKSYFVYGFSDIEPEGRWSMGDESLIRFKNGESDQKHSLEIEVNTLPGVTQVFDVYVNSSVENYSISGTETLSFDIANDTAETIIGFKYHEINTPKQLGINDDGRELALFFRSMELR